MCDHDKDVNDEKCSTTGTLERLLWGSSFAMAWWSSTWEVLYNVSRVFGKFDCNQRDTRAI